MRRSRRLLVLSATVLASCLPQASGSGGGKQQNNQDSGIGPVLSAPSAAALRVQTTGNTGTVNVMVDLIALDADGNSYGQVVSGQVRFDPPTDESGQLGTVSGTVACTSTAFQNTERSASVVLLMDQSGSIAGTDPMNARIAGGKAFLQAANGDDVLLMSFADVSGGSNPCATTNVVTYGSFSTDPGSFSSKLDDLANCIGGGTPLWDATMQSIDQVIGHSKSGAKAVVVFTDGEDSGSTATVDDVVAKATGANVKVFTVGLSSSVAVSVLGEVSQRTGGAFFYAPGAENMVSAFRGMNLVITGSYDKHTCQQQMTLPVSASSTYATSLSTMVHVQVNGLDAVAPAILAFPPSLGSGGYTGAGGDTGAGGYDFGAGGSPYATGGYYGAGGSPFGGGGAIGAGGSGAAQCPAVTDFNLASPTYKLNGIITNGVMNGELYTSGSASTSRVPMTFTLYPSLTGGSVLWQELQGVTVTNGCFATAQLGTNGGGSMPVGDSYLEVSILGEVFSPRVPVTVQ